MTCLSCNIHAHSGWSLSGHSQQRSLFLVWTKFFAARTVNVFTFPSYQRPPFQYGCILLGNRVALSDRDYCNIGFILKQYCKVTHPTRFKYIGTLPKTPWKTTSEVRRSPPIMLVGWHANLTLQCYVFMCVSLFGSNTHSVHTNTSLALTMGGPNFGSFHCMCPQ